MLHSYVTDMAALVTPTIQIPSFLGSLWVQRYIVFMSLHDSSAGYWTSKKGLPHDLLKMPEAITRWPLLVELQYWLSRLQRVRLPYRSSFRFLWNMRVLIFEIFGQFVLECPTWYLKEITHLRHFFENIVNNFHNTVFHSLFRNTYYFPN